MATTCLIYNNDEEHWFNVPAHLIPKKLMKLSGMRFDCCQVWWSYRELIHTYFGIALDSILIDEPTTKMIQIRDTEPRFEEYRAKGPFIINPSSKILIISLADET